MAENCFAIQKIVLLIRTIVGYAFKFGFDF